MKPGNKPNKIKCSKSDLYSLNIDLRLNKLSVKEETLSFKKLFQSNVIMLRYLLRKKINR